MIVNEYFLINDTKSSPVLLSLVVLETTKPLDPLLIFKQNGAISPQNLLPLESHVQNVKLVFLQRTLILSKVLIVNFLGVPDLAEPEDIEHVHLYLCINTKLLFRSSYFS